MTNLNREVLKLHKQGYSFNQIAQELDISKSKAYRIVNDSLDDPLNENQLKQPVSDAFQSVPERFSNERKSGNKSEDDLKLRLKLRKIELEHEAEMRRLELEESDRIRKSEAVNQALSDENWMLKNELDDISSEIEKLKEITLEQKKDLELQKEMKYLQENAEDGLESEDENEPFEINFGSSNCRQHIKR